MSDEAAVDGPGSDDDDYAEVRAAASDVLASLKRFVEAAERVVERPDTFTNAVDSGRNIVEAFVSGFAAQAAEPPTEPPAEAGSPQ